MQKRMPNGVSKKIKSKTGDSELELFLWPDGKLSVRTIASAKEEFCEEGKACSDFVGLEKNDVEELIRFLNKRL